MHLLVDPCARLLADVHLRQSVRCSARAEQNHRPTSETAQPGPKIAFRPLAGNAATSALYIPHYDHNINIRAVRATACY